MTVKSTCPNCGNQFEKVNDRKIYCKPSCKVIAYQKRNGIAKPDFLKPKTETRITGIKDYIEVQKERDVIKTVDNPVYMETHLRYTNLSANVLILEKRRDGLLLSRQKFLTRHDDVIGAVGGGVIAFAISENPFIGLAGALLGYFAGDEIKKQREYKILQKVKEFDIMLLETENAITNTKSNALRIFLELKKIPTKNFVTVKETYIEKLPKLEIELPQLEKIPLLANNQNEEIAIGNTPKGVLSLSKFQEMTFKTLPFSENWGDVFGNPQENFRMMIYGISGHGKSYFSAKFAEYLGNSHGKVLYNAAEEGLNKSLQNKMQNLNSPYLHIGSYKSFKDLKKAVKDGAYRFVVIDSVNEMSLTPSELKELWEMDKKRGIIYIMQVTKGGDFKGDNAFKHDSDIIVRIENRTPVIEKNRYK